MDWRYLDVAEFFNIAAGVTGVPADTLASSEYVLLRAQAALYAPRAGIDGRELYPTLCEKAGILVFRILEERPFPNNNIRIAWSALDLFIRDNSAQVSPPAADEINQACAAVIAGHSGERDFIQWICKRVVVGAPAP